MDRDVPLIDGGKRRYVNLDYAASTPALVEVAAAVEAMLPWYSSVHRGLGWKSQISTAAYEGARQAVAEFFGSRPDDAVIFTRCTTDAINMLSQCLPEGTRVITSPVEHHANMLPWRRVHVDYLSIPTGPDHLLQDLECQLAKTGYRHTLVALAGASNVTGQIAPIREIVQLAHRYGARAFVDAAQLAPHVGIDIAALDVDYLAMSGHKLYAPFGAGVLIGRPDWLRAAPPYVRGGGAVEFVSLDDVLWSDLPDRQEAGSPNVIGAVAVGVACAALHAYGMERLAAEEAELREYACRRLAAVPGLRRYSLWLPSSPHVGVIPFNLDGYHHNKVAAILSAEYGIGVRGGCFCAHPYMLHILQVCEDDAGRIREEIRGGVKHAVPGAVRASFGLGTVAEDIDYLTSALTAIARHGPRWSYASLPNGDYAPVPETRAWPAVPFPLAAETVSGAGESS
jgi:selenocysteine lyase/cysteine desulfurase